VAFQFKIDGPPHIRAHVALVVSHDGKAKVQESGALMRQKAGEYAGSTLGLTIRLVAGLDLKEPRPRMILE
jgi:hypothetical protein